MEKERFSLLLLDPNEIYFEDFSVDLLPSQFIKNKNDDSVIGFLKLCSKSLVFEPKNIQLPLIKLRYTDCYEITDSISAEDNNEYKNYKNCLIIRCLQSIDMLKKNIIAPYEFIRQKQTFAFNFHYANVSDVLRLSQQLHRASSLHASEQNDMIATILYSRHNRKEFNPLWLQNIYEKKLFECKVDEIHPLVVNPGRLLLTNSFIYFQPYNNILPYPVIKIEICNITGFTKKRFLLRYTGLEIRWKQDNKNLYVSFRNSSERDKFCQLTEEQSDFNLPLVKPESMTLKWQNRLISNYDYLMYLNRLADRSFEDLTQYPVFPWVLTDYTSATINLQDKHVYRDLTKPIGALNLQRLERLKERTEEMDEPKYLYGSHYSNPGFVLFYLVRKFPHLMLCLQNGKFDYPDRMFNKISDTFNNCLINMADFKELIPEFYDTSGKGDFLLNIHKINFGNRSDGSPVNNVILPQWAKNSTEKFISVLREALESDYVSANLHHWIDLIFGYKQRGKEAIKADNVFHHICYEGSVDLDSIKDAAERHALEVQISEFGQIPKQVFYTPHVARNLVSPTEPISPIRNGLNISFTDKTYELVLKESYSAHKDKITSIWIEGQNIISSGKDGILKFYSMTERRQTRSISFGHLPLSSCVKIPDSNVYAVGSWDNTISLYNCNYGKITDVIPAHDDSVSCLNMVESLGILISGSWDCSIKVWKGFKSLDYKSFSLSNSMIGYYSFDDNVVNLTHRINDEFLQIAVGTDSGDIFMWDILLNDIVNNCINCEPKKFLKHPGEIQTMEYNKALTKFASCSLDGLLLVTDITTRMELFKRQLDNTPKWLCWCDNSDILLNVDDQGFIFIWDLLSGDLRYNLKISNGPLSLVRYSQENDLVITGGQNQNEYKIQCWNFK